MVDAPGGDASALARAASGSGLILAVCLLSGMLGPHEEVLANSGAAAGLLLWAGGSARRVVRPVLAAAIGLPLLFMLPSPEARLAAAAGIVLAGRPAAVAGGSFVASVLAWRLIEAHAPIVWSTGVELSRGVSAVAGALTGQPLDLGPSASGIDLSVVAILFAATHGPIDGRRGVPMKVLLSGAAVMAYCALVPFMSGLVLESRLAAVLPFGRSVAGAIFGCKTALLAVLCLVVFRVPASRRKWRAAPPAIAVCAALAVLLVAGLADPDTSAAHRKPGRIVFLKSPIADTHVPQRGLYGISRSGMFGLLPRYLALDGHLTTLHDGPLTRRVIDSASVLVVALPVRPMSRWERDSIRTFVARGGSLLAMGDHTDLLGIMKPLNELTGEWGVHFRFDSAYPAVNRWRRCISPGDAGGLPTGIGTGASLQISPPARPLLVARYALSDAGDRSNGGAGAYLGNYSYDAGERLGDLVVAAVARHGEGRVAVLGDTSSFQNIQLPTSYSFVASLISDLAGPPRRAPWKDHGVVLLAVVLASLSLARIRSAAAGIAVATVAGSVLSILLSGPAPLERLPAGAPVALIDSAHLNGYSRNLWRPESIGGFLVGLQRNGFLPLMVEGELPSGPWGASALAVLIEPRHPLSRSELGDLLAHLQLGGRVMVVAGTQGGRTLGSLLASHGIAIGSLPLGPHPVRPDMDEAGLARARRTPQFRRAHPVVSTGSILPRSHYRAFDLDVVVEAGTGAGGSLIVLADPDFLSDRVLENEHDAWEGNVAFLSRLLEGS